MEIVMSKQKNHKAQAIENWRLKVDLYDIIHVDATMEINADDLIYHHEKDVSDGWGFYDHYDAYWSVNLPIGVTKSREVIIDEKDIPNNVREYVISGKNKELEAEEIKAYYVQRMNNNNGRLFQ